MACNRIARYKPILLLLGSLFTYFPAQLHAQQPNVIYTIANRLSGKVIDDPTQCYFSNGCLLQQYDANGGPQQSWSLVPAGQPGFFNLTNYASGKVIDVPTPACVDNNGCQLQQYDSNGSWQQQWTLVPADAAGQYSIINRLSGKAIDVPTPACVYNNGCLLQQWDSNGSWQQQWQFNAQSNGPASPPASGVTVLVNGSFDEDPSWTMSSDPEYQAIAATFGDQPIAYEWTPNSDVFAPFYLDIFSGGDNFAGFLNSLNVPAWQTLSIVAHSHGGNVVKIATYNLSHPINYLVNLGTPQNWDLPEINLCSVQQYCQVSSLADFTQFIGSSPTQVAEFANDEYAAAVWIAQEAEDLSQANYGDALGDAGWAAYNEADAFYWFMSTKLAYGARNVIYTDLSHSDLHTAPVWANIQHDCGLSQ